MDLVPILVPLGFFAMIAYVAKVIGDTRIRRKALEASVSDEVAEAVMTRRRVEPSARSALKWGLIIVALGGSMFLVEILPTSFESPMAYGILLLATGIALLGYYLIERENQLPIDASGSPQEASPRASVQEPEL